MRTRRPESPITTRRPDTISELLASVTQAIRARLPGTWTVAKGKPSFRALGGRIPPPALVLMLTAPDGAEVRVVIEAKSTRSSLPVVRSAAEQVRRYIGQLASAGIRAGELVAMPHVSPAGRRYLRDLGLGYADPTGNLRLQAETPGSSTQSLGTDRDPRPQSSALRNLKGPAPAAPSPTSGRRWGFASWRSG